MPINIQELFSGILSPAGVTGQPAQPARPAANVIGQLGAIADAGQANLSSSLRRSVGGLFGKDLSTSAERLKIGLQGVDTSTPEGQEIAIELLSKVDPTKAIALRAAFAEQRRDQQKVDAQTAQAAAAVERSKAATGAVDVSRLQLPISQQSADTAKSNSAILRDRLDLDVNVEENDVIDNAALRAIQKRKNEIDAENAATARLIAENSTDDLGATRTAANNKLIQASFDARNKAVKAGRLADSYEILLPPGGARGRGWTHFKNFLGTQNEQDLAKTEFNQLVNASVMDSLPPGPASDVDVALAQLGFPNDRYGPQLIAQYLRGVAKAAALTAEFENERAKWAGAHKGSQVGFVEEWDRIKNDPSFNSRLEDRYSFEWKPETPEQAAARELRKSSGKSIFDIAREERARRVESTRRGMQPRRN